ncbi:MAG: ribonuclease HI family protein [Myxococcaceae bacterium]|nr:ribonuclease HI family protein [Myxococcaceae bacterium]
MSQSRVTEPRASAALLRAWAAECRSGAELCARIESLDPAVLRRLLCDVAAALDGLPNPDGQAAEKAAAGGGGSAAAKPVKAALSGASRQESFGFGGQVASARTADASSATSASRTASTPKAVSAASKAVASEAKAPRANERGAQTATTIQPRKLLLYSDGASRGNPGPAGAGAVLMKPDGTIVARIGKYLGRQTNNHAEYMALIIGLRAALELGVTEIEMVADSELMVKQIKKIYRVKNEQLRPLYEEACALIARFHRASIRHVLREYNREADEMSNRAIDERM